MATNTTAKKAAPNKQQMAYEFIKAGIEGGTFAPRQRLVIDSLARELSVSQVPVREAIRRLEAEGLVEFSANSGAVVAGADPQLWFQLMELLALMEGYATAMAATAITQRDIRKLREVNEGMRKALEQLDFHAWSEGNVTFHSIINARCANQSLVEQMDGLKARVSAISRFLFPRSEAAILHTLGPGSGKSALEAHEWLVTAFERDEAANSIERHAREHILHVASATYEILQSGSKVSGKPRRRSPRP
jgi:DNA-binding GntR family transcriptional regulator